MARPRILFNDLIRFRSSGGISTYVKGILPFIQTIVTPFSQTVFGFPLAQLSKRKAIRPGIQKDSSFERLSNFIDTYLGFRKYALFHEPDFIVPQTKIPAIATVHDLSPLIHPEFHPDYRVKKFEKALKKSIERTAHFICNSTYTCSDLMKVLGVPAGRCSITPLAPGPLFQAASPSQILTFKKRYGLPENYFLFIGTFEPRKNIPFLLKTYDSLDAAFKKHFPLILAGNWGWNSHEIEKTWKELREPEYFRHLVSMTDSEMNLLVNGATALLFPSFAEGFGLPLLEAFSCEKPVICSDLPVFHEVAEDAALYCKLGDEEGWKKEIREIAENSILRNSLVQKSKPILSRYSWKNTAELTLEAYKKVLSE